MFGVLSSLNQGSRECKVDGRNVTQSQPRQGTCHIEVLISGVTSNQRCVLCGGDGTSDMEVTSRVRRDRNSHDRRVCGGER